MGEQCDYNTNGDGNDRDQFDKALDLLVNGESDQNPSQLQVQHGSHNGVIPRLDHHVSGCMSGLIVTGTLSPVKLELPTLTSRVSMILMSDGVLSLPDVNDSNHHHTASPSLRTLDLVYCTAMLMSF